jgi:CHASE3 domain sensor protein
MMLAKFRFKTIRGRILFISGGLIALLIMGFVLLTYRNTRHAIQEHRRQLLQAYSEDLLTAIQQNCGLA